MRKQGALATTLYIEKVQLGSEKSGPVLFGARKANTTICRLYSPRKELGQAKETKNVYLNILLAKTILRQTSNTVYIYNIKYETQRECSFFPCTSNNMLKLAQV